MQTILNQLKIKAEVVGEESNGVMTRYFLQLHPGAKVGKIENCATEIALGLKSYSKPIIKILMDRGLISLEVLTKPINSVSYSYLLSEFKKSNASLPLLLGLSHDGYSVIADLTKMPHLLIAGATGSGKSVLLHSIINSLSENNNTKLILIDPKMVEFNYYNDIDNLLYPVINSSDDALDVLLQLNLEMQNRFRLMSKVSVNNIEKYNIKLKKKMPYIVLIIDEFSDLMHSSKKEFQKNLCMLAQKSRACGIHIIIATQRPSVDVVTGLIKANFPARISCMVSSLTDSRVILDSGGAEKLLGKGDSIINAPGYDMVRFQGAYLNQEEILKLCNNHKRDRFYNIKNFFRRII